MIYTTVISNALIIVCVCFALHACTWPGMIFGKLGTAYENYYNLGEKFYPSWMWIAKPLFACQVCMCPWWGSLILFYMNNTTTLKEYPLILLTATGISAIIVFLKSE